MVQGWPQDQQRSGGLHSHAHGTLPQSPQVKAISSDDSHLHCRDIRAGPGTAVWLRSGYRSGGPGSRYGRRMRDGALLSGRAPGQVLSQLAHRVLGPLQPARTRAVLDYHGLLNHPAGSLVQIGCRHHVTSAHRFQQRRQAPGRRLPAGRHQRLCGDQPATVRRPGAPGTAHAHRARTSHLRRRHHLYVHAVDVAALGNAALRGVAAAVRLGVERWADEDAAAMMAGDRTSAATALAKTALTRAALRRGETPPTSRRRPVVTVLGVATSHVTQRAQALLAPTPERSALAAWVAVLLLAMCAATLTSALQIHDGFEHAEIIRRIISR